ncbi:MAG: hypothetical protein J5699_05945 [Bacteroidales bacterium]|nr:hypothetical protein [Bacteroidales bacterium]
MKDAAGCAFGVAGMMFAFIGLGALSGGLSSLVLGLLLATLEDFILSFRVVNLKKPMMTVVAVKKMRVTLSNGRNKQFEFYKYRYVNEY